MSRWAAGRSVARGFAKSGLGDFRSGRTVAWVIVCLGLWGKAGSAQPDSKPPPPPPPPPASDGPTIEITVVGGAKDLERIRSTIEPRPIAGFKPRWTVVARFEPMQILQTLAESPQTVVHGWVDLSDPRRAQLYFAARSGARFLVRDVELSRNFDEVDRESLANVLELSITALVDNERVGLTRAEAREVLASREPSNQSPIRDAPSPSPKADVPSPLPTIAEQPSRGTGPRFRVDLRAFYAGVAAGGGLPIAEGPGLELALSGRAPQRPTMGVWLSGQYRLAAQYSGDSVGAEFQSIAARGGLELLLPVSANARVNARAGVGTDSVHLSPGPGSTDPTAMLTPARWSQSLAFTVAVGIRRAVGSRLVLGLAILADVLPTVVHYDQAVAGMSSEVISPRRIRPGLMIEVGVH